MIRVHLKVEIGADDDNWLAGVSTDFPDTEFKILTSQPVDDGVLELIEVTTSDEDAIVRRFDDASEVRSFDVLHSDDGLVLVQLEFPMPSTYEARRSKGILPRFPILIRDGWASGEQMNSQEQLSKLTTELAAAHISYKILSLTHSYDSNGLLTERQREVITEAVERGYYDSPRDCTLVELAETMEVNQSAVSGVLHRAESRIIKELFRRETWFEGALTLCDTTSTNSSTDTDYCEDPGTDSNIAR